MPKTARSGRKRPPYCGKLPQHITNDHPMCSPMLARDLLSNFRHSKKISHPRLHKTPPLTPHRMKDAPPPPLLHNKKKSSSQRTSPNKISTAKHFNGKRPILDKRISTKDFEQAYDHQGPDYFIGRVRSPLRERIEILKSKDPEVVKCHTKLSSALFAYDELSDGEEDEDANGSDCSSITTQSRKSYVPPPTENLDVPTIVDMYGAPLPVAPPPPQAPPAPLEQIHDLGAGSVTTVNTNNPLYEAAKREELDNIGYQPLDQVETHYVYCLNDRHNVELLLHLRYFRAPLYAYDIMKFWENPDGRNYTRDAFLNYLWKKHPTVPRAEFVRMPLETDELALYKELTALSIDDPERNYTVLQEDLLLYPYIRTKRDTVEVVRYMFVHQMLDLLTEPFWGNVNDLCVNRDKEGTHDDRYRIFQPYDNPKGAQLDDIVSGEYYQLKCKPLITNKNKQVLLPVILHVDACGKGKSQRNNVEPLSFACIIANRRYANQYSGTGATLIFVTTHTISISTLAAHATVGRLGGCLESCPTWNKVPPLRSRETIPQPTGRVETIATTMMQCP